MRGKCQFEKDKPRAQRASYSFEFFRLASDLVHLTYNMGNKLTIDEIAACIEKAKELSVLKYSHIQKILAEDVEDEINFDYVRGLKRKDLIKDETEAKKKALEQKLGELKFYHAIKMALKDQPAEWKDIESNIELFDNIGFVLTANKEDDSVREELEKLGLKPSVVDGISNLSQVLVTYHLRLFVKLLHLYCRGKLMIKLLLMLVISLPPNFLATRIVCRLSQRKKIIKSPIQL